MTYTEEQVQEALEWADGPRVPPVQILAAALRYARAERARLLDEAAERAVAWLKTLHHEPEEGLPWSGKIRRIQDLQVRTLRAAITKAEGEV